MVAIHLAYTAPINPPDVSPALTLQQCFAGLQRKVRHGDEFVPVIESTEVIEESVDPKTHTPIVVRDIVFKKGFGPMWAWNDEARAENREGRVRERCTLSPLGGSGGCKVGFELADGAKIENIISEGGKGELYLTYAFEWFVPSVDPSDDMKIDEKRAGFLETGRLAVEKSIDAIREMVKDGRIPS